MKIAILTGGGDVPGLNSAIKGLTTGALERGWQVVGFRRGWKGLLAYDRNDPKTHGDNVMPLTYENTRTIDRDGGTFLHSSRTNPSNVKQKDLPKFLHGASEVKDKGGGVF